MRGVAVTLVVAASLVVACRPSSDVRSPASTPSTVTTLRTFTYFADCDTAREANAVPLRRGDPGYRSPLDRDGDGVACDGPTDEGR